LNILSYVIFGAFTATPHHERLGAHLGCEVEVAKSLAQSEAANTAIVAGEGAVFEHRVTEQVRGHHGNDEARVGERLLEPIDLLLAFCVGASERKEVVIVEGHAVCADLGKLLDGLNDVEVFTSGRTEWILRGPADGPQTEREFVIA
jgi:hypothetical protein